MRHYQAERTRVVEMKCVNRHCDERNIVKEFRAFEELGGLFLVNDDDVNCCECGEEMVSVA